MTDDRRNALNRREILEGYLAVLERPAYLVEVCSAVDGDIDELRSAVQDAFGLSALAAHAVVALQVRRFTPAERRKLRNELADIDLSLNQHPDK